MAAVVVQAGWQIEVPVQAVQHAIQTEGVHRPCVGSIRVAEVETRRSNRIGNDRPGETS